jgi:hypothetical protein
MNYLKREQVTVERLTCSHPKVSRIWEYGGLASTPTNSEAVRYICILMEGDTHPIQFTDNGDINAINELEKYLQAIPHD